MVALAQDWKHFQHLFSFLLKHKFCSISVLHTSLNCLDTDIEILQFRLVNFVSPKTFGDFCLHRNTSDRGFITIHVKLLNTTPTRKLISKCKQTVEASPSLANAGPSAELGDSLEGLSAQKMLFSFTRQEKGGKFKVFATPHKGFERPQ